MFKIKLKIAAACFAVLAMTVLFSGTAASQTATPTLVIPNTFTPAPTVTLTPARTATQTYTATTSLLSANLYEVNVVNASATGTTTTALPAGFTTGHYRIAGCIPVNYTPPTGTAGYIFDQVDMGGAVKIIVQNAYGSKVRLDKNPITFHLTVIRQNYD